MVSTRSNRGPTAGQWIAKQEIIRDLYLIQKLRLQDVQKIMREQHGFVASIEMFKRRFSKWGWMKNKNSTVMVAAQRRRSLEDRLGKRNIFSCRGRLFTDADVDSYVKRRKEHDRRKRVEPLDQSASTVDDLVCWTPRSDSPDATMSSASSQMASNSESSYDEFDDWAVLTMSSGSSSSSSGIVSVNQDLQDRTYPFTNVQRVLLPTGLETEVEFMTVSLNNLYTSNFDTGEWFSIGILQPCSSAAMKNTVSLDLETELDDTLYACFENCRQERPAHAIAHMDRACQMVKDFLIRNEPGILGTLLRRMVCFRHHTHPSAKYLKRVFLSHFAQCASIVYGSSFHPHVGLANLISRHDANRDAIRVLLESTQASFERFLPKNHWQNFSSRYDTLLSTTSNVATCLPGWEAYVQDVQMCMTPTLGMYSNAVLQLSYQYLKFERYEDIERLFHDSRLLCPLLNGDYSTLKPRHLEGALCLAIANSLRGKHQEAVVVLRAVTNAILYFAETPEVFPLVDARCLIRERAIFLAGYCQESETIGLCNELLHELNKIEQQEQKWVENELGKLKLN